MKEALETLELGKFKPFLQRASGGDCAIALCDQGGVQQASGRDEAISTLEGSILRFRETVDNGSLEPRKPFSIRLDSGELIFVMRMELGAAQSEIWLAVLAGKAVDACESDRYQKISGTVEDIAACLSDDFNSSMAMAGMANELAVRYEELNLLYGMDDNSYLVCKNERDALNQLLSHCYEYLNVDLITLVLPGEELCLHHPCAENCSLDLPLLMPKLLGPLTRYIKSTRETLVINRDADTDWTDANLDLPYKLIAAPVYKGNDKVCGTLITINGMDKPDFSNSDRKLCEVLAAEATKLIHSRRDSTTGLLNRRGFEEKLEDAISDVKTQGKKFSLLYIDIDQFKVVNDTSGHIAGDELLLSLIHI